MKKNCFLPLLLLAGLLVFTSCGKTSYFEDSGKDSAFSEEKADDAGVSGDEDETEEGSSAAAKAGESATDDGKAVSSEPARLFVEVSGAVQQPGVFEVTEGTRVFEVLSRAGGLAADADTRDLNQAAPVTDGQKIYVLRQGETPPATASAGSTGSGTGSGGGNALVNINTADAAALTTLPGIGEQKARAIIAYRQEKGSFRKIEDLKQIPGIKDGLFSKVKDRITV